VLTVFLLGTGFLYWQTYNALTDVGPRGVEYPMGAILGDGSEGLTFPVFWLVFLFVPPLLTMRLFAEERASGTMEMLMTAPVKDWQIVFAKFVGCFAFYLLMWLPTLLYLPILMDLHATWDFHAWTPYSIAFVAGIAVVVLGILTMPAGFVGRGFLLALIGAAVAVVGGYLHYAKDQHHVVSLSAGIVSQAIALTLGLTMGLTAGYYGHWVDEVVMRLADVTLAFPTLLLLIAMAAALQPSIGVVFVTIGIVGWAGMARLVRGQVLVVRQLEFVQASRALGARDVRVVLKHVLPNVVAPVLIAATLGIAAAIMAEASLSFLGLGVQPPTPSWGSMIADGRDLNQLRNAPWTSVAPGLAIGAAVLGFNLLGDALRDALDPRHAARSGAIEAPGSERV